MAAVPIPVDQALLDAVLDDAEGRRDASRFLSNDPLAWRRAVAALLDDVRAEIAEVNADLKANHPRSYRAHELNQHRSELTRRQASLETRMRHVKALVEALPKPAKKERPAPPSLDGESPVERARAHLYAAIDLLRLVGGADT